MPLLYNAYNGGSDDQTPDPANKIVITFAKTDSKNTTAVPSDPLVIADMKNCSVSTTAATYNDENYPNPLKMQTGTEFKINSGIGKKVTIVSVATKKTKLNGTSIAADENGLITFVSKTGVDTIAKGDSTTIICIIIE